jgi:hypothetical protein
MYLTVTCSEHVSQVVCMEKFGKNVTHIRKKTFYLQSCKGTHNSKLKKTVKKAHCINFFEFFEDRTFKSRFWKIFRKIITKSRMFV